MKIRIPPALFLILLAGCARMEPPPGGPVDTVRPFVAGVYPAPGAVNAPRDLQARIAFSEWVNKDVEKGKVHLSPPTARKLKVEAKGNVVEVSSTSPLDSGTTYVLGVAGTVRDLNGLPLEAPFQLIFSTGPRIDSGTLSGRLSVFPGTLPTPGTFAALYPDDPALRARFSHLSRRSGPAQASLADSLPQAFREKPAYLAPVDSLGRFEMVGVRPGRYRVLGFQDMDQDGAPDAGSELLALGTPVAVEPKGVPVQSLALAAVDTVPSRLTDARWAHESMVTGRTLGTVRLKFSRPVHPVRGLRRELYTISKAGPVAAGSASNAVPVMDICLNPETGEVELYTAPLLAESSYTVQCGPVPDVQGNPIDTSRDEAPFRATLAQAAAPSATGSTPAAPSYSKGPDSGQSAEAYLAPLFLGPLKPSGLREKLPREDLIPTKGMTAYYPRVLTDSLLGDLSKHMEVKSDTVPVTFFISRISHHEFSLKLGPVALKGQRLQIGFKSPKTAADTATGKALPGTPKPGGKVPQGGTAPQVPGTPAPTGAAPAVAAPAGPSVSFILADSTQLGALQFLQDASARGSRLVLRSLSSPLEHSLTTPLRDDFIVDSLPKGWYSAEYFRDGDGDAIWYPGKAKPWIPQEAFVHFADSIEVKPGGVSATGASGRKLTFPPVW